MPPPPVPRTAALVLSVAALAPDTLGPGGESLTDLLAEQSQIHSIASLERVRDVAAQVMSHHGGVSSMHADVAICLQLLGDSCYRTCRVSEGREYYE